MVLARGQWFPPYKNLRTDEHGTLYSMYITTAVLFIVSIVRCFPACLLRLRITLFIVATKPISSRVSIHLIKKL